MGKNESALYLLRYLYYVVSMCKAPLDSEKHRGSVIVYLVSELDVLCDAFYTSPESQLDRRFAYELSLRGVIRQHCLKLRTGKAVGLHKGQGRGESLVECAVCGAGRRLRKAYGAR